MKPETQPESFPRSGQHGCHLVYPDSARRGIQLSHTNLVTTAVQMVDWAPGASRHGSIMSAVPFHRNGLTLGVNLAVHAASRITCFRKQISSGLRTMRLMEAVHRCQYTAYLRSFCEFPGLAQFGITLAGFLSTDCAVALGSKVFERLSHTPWSDVMAWIETATVPCNPLQRNRTGSVGLPLPGVRAEVRDLRVVSRSHFSMSAGGLLRGPQVMCGYLDRRDRQRLSGRWLVGDG